MQTQFEIDDALEFTRKLTILIGVLSQEFDRLFNQWDNLKATWHDHQCDEFRNDLFDDFLDRFKRVLKDYEDHRYYLDQKIKIAQELKTLSKLSQALLNNNDRGIDTRNNTIASDNNNLKPEDLPKIEKIWVFWV